MEMAPQNISATDKIPSQTVTSSADWRGICVRDIVQLAPGEQGSNVLWPGEAGVVVQDERRGSAPFRIQGPRGHKGWFRGESLVVVTFASSSAKPLIQQVIEGLDPQVNLDFPRLTDMCEVAAQNPEDCDLAASLLVATLGRQDTKAGDVRNVTKDYLKVVTILNEMVYDPALVEVLRRTPGMKEALERLRSFREGDLGDANDENIRMLATEIEKCIFQGSKRALKPAPRTDIIEFCPKGHPLSWLGGQTIFHIHDRQCAVCSKGFQRLDERYNCATCRYYDVCISCIRWGSPQHRGSESTKSTSGNSVPSFGYSGAPSGDAQHPIASTGLRAGCRVQLHTLKTAADLNGQLGELSTFDVERDRWNVKLDSGDIKSLKPENLRPEGMHAGSRVRLQGLRTAAALNGQLGMLHTFDQARERWRVKLDNGLYKDLKVENLTPEGKGSLSWLRDS